MGNHDHSWCSRSRDRDEFTDSILPPTLSCCHWGLEAIDSLRQQAGLTEDDTSPPVPHLPILPVLKLRHLPMDILSGIVPSHIPLALLGDVPLLQVVGALSNSVVSPGSGATTRDCVSLDLSQPFALMPIIQVSAGLLKRKGRGRPIKRGRVLRVHPIKQVLSVSNQRRR